MIDINDKWAIDVDERNYMPVMKSSFYVDKKTGKTGCIRKVYFGNLQDAMMYIAKTDARESLGQKDYSLKEAVREINSIFNNYTELLKEVMKYEES